MNIKSLIRTVPDFPKPGIMFRDITPLLASGAGFRHVITALAERYAGKVDRSGSAGPRSTAEGQCGVTIDKVVGIEARGFIFGAAVAHTIGAGFVPVRKPGKLPHTAIGHDYALEYGSNRVELHVDGVARGERVVIVDDLLATGGTALAALALVEQCGAEVVECAFVIELTDLPGRARIEAIGHRVHALCGFVETEA
jgi:adenine phosphoribosyltransferase